MAQTDIKTLEKVENIIKKAPKLTLNDAAAATGLAVNEARNLMLTLVQRYYCKVQVTENGDLLYDFGQLQRRNEKTWEERKEEIKKQLWNAFKVFFKVWITVTLVVYFFIFVAILITALIAANSKDDKKKSSDTYGDALKGISKMIELLLRWQFYRDIIYYEKDEYGQPYKHYKPASDLQKNEKSFIVAVYDFVFGPPRVETDAEAHFKEIAAFCRKNNGVISLQEIKALTGANTEKAEKLMADAVVRFNGSIELSPEGVLYADLYELTRSKNAKQDAEIVWFWDEYEPEYEFTGNSNGKNALIFFLNAFNWVFSSVFLFGGNNEEMAIWIGLGFVPFVFSLLFFAIPVGRYFYLQPLIKQRNIDNIRKKIWKVFYLDTKTIISTETIEKTALTTPNGKKPMTTEALKKILQEEMHDWNAQPHFNENGTTDYDFSALRNVQTTMQTIRKNRQQSNNDFGNVLYELDN
jgi:hypothetical protein